MTTQNRQKSNVKIKEEKVTSHTKINKYYNHVSKKTADFFFAQTYLDVQY